MRIGLSRRPGSRHHAKLRRLSVDRRGEGAGSFRRPDVSSVRSRVGRRATGRAILGVVRRPDGSLWARVSGARALPFPQGRIQNILPDVGPPNRLCQRMLRGRDDAMLLATLGRGAAGLSRRTLRHRLRPRRRCRAPRSSSRWLKRRRRRRLARHTRRGAPSSTKGAVTRITEGLPDLKINCLLAGNDGEIWIGTDRGSSGGMARRLRRPAFRRALSGHRHCT